MSPKLHPRGSQPEEEADPPSDAEDALARRVRAAIGSHLGGRRLVLLKIRQVDGKNVDGILKLERGNGELQMVDFKAATGADGSLSFLEVGGRRISEVNEGKRTR